MKAIKVIAVLLVFAALLLGLGFGLYDVKDVQVPTRTEVEDAIGAKSSGNKFVFQNGVSFNSQNAIPQQLFIELVPESANIYVSSTVDYYDNSFKKIYWTFTSDGANILIYEDVYKLANYIVEKYIGDTLFLHYDNLDWVLAVLFVTFLIGAVISFDLSRRVLKQKDKGTA